MKSYKIQSQIFLHHTNIYIVFWERLKAEACDLRVVTQEDLELIRFMEYLAISVAMATIVKIFGLRHCGCCSTA